MYGGYDKLWITFGMFLSLLLLATGCSGTPTVVFPPDTLPIKVYRVIGPFDAAGDPFNDGCRLADAEISQVIRQFQSNSTVLFGARCQINWDGIIYTAVDTSIVSRTNQPLQNFFAWLQNSQLSNPGLYIDSSRINIYFTGNLSTGSSGQLWGAAVDPLAASSAPLLQPGVVLINDGGFNGGGSDVPGIMSRMTLEHEIGHYLGRFNYNIIPPSGVGVASDRTYGSVPLGTNRTFLANLEHVFSPVNHVMLDGNLVPSSGRRANLPGFQHPDYVGQIPAGYDFDDQFGAEKGEVSRKLGRGEYNDRRR